MNDYKIYCYTSPSNKKYIGQTNKPLQYRANHGEGYIGCPAFYKAIKKYGWSWFENHVEILATNLDKQEADRLEKYYIKQFDSIKHGYNIQSGGEFSPAEILSIPIVGINCQTKEIVFFNSAVEAAKKIHGSNKNITGCLKNRNNGKTSHGYVWVYKTEWDIMDDIQRQKLFDIMPYDHSIRKKKVLCVETQEVYNSLKEAAEQYGTYSSGISKCCKGTQKTAGGVHWQYIESED